MTRGQTLSVRERVYPLKGVHNIDTPKSRAGVRTIAIPTTLAEQLEQHLDQFTGGSLAAGVRDRERRQHPYDVLPNAAPRPESHRAANDAPPRPAAYGMTLAAQAGASLAELKHRLGQSITQAAEIYMHATADHGRRIAERMDEMAQEPSNVRPIKRRTAG